MENYWWFTTQRFTISILNLEKLKVFVRFNIFAFRTNFCYITYFHGGRDSSVGIATRYGLDGPGIESQWGSRFSAPVQTGPGAHPAFYTMGIGSFPKAKRPGRGADHPPTSRTEVKGRVELYICYPSGPLWPVLGRTLPLPLPFI